MTLERNFKKLYKRLKIDIENTKNALKKRKVFIENLESLLSKRIKNDFKEYEATNIDTEKAFLISIDKKGRIIGKLNEAYLEKVYPKQNLRNYKAIVFTLEDYNNSLKNTNKKALTNLFKEIIKTFEKNKELLEYVVIKVKTNDLPEQNKRGFIELAYRFGHIELKTDLNTYFSLQKVFNQFPQHLKVKSWNKYQSETNNPLHMFDEKRILFSYFNNISDNLLSKYIKKIDIVKENNNAILELNINLKNITLSKYKKIIKELNNILKKADKNLLINYLNVDDIKLQIKNL